MSAGWVVFLVLIGMAIGGLLGSIAVALYIGGAFKR
jgi:hypothetical protein